MKRQTHLLLPTIQFPKHLMVYVFMCVRVRVCTHALMYGGAHAFGGPGLRSSVFLYWSPPDLPREGLSPNLELTIQTMSDTG